MPSRFDVQLTDFKRDLAAAADDIPARVETAAEPVNVAAHATAAAAPRRTGALAASVAATVGPTTALEIGAAYAAPVEARTGFVGETLDRVADQILDAYGDAVDDVLDEAFPD